MPYVITSACIGTMDLSCLSVCPVDCIHPVEEDDPEAFAAASQVFIDPAECIDCNACAEVCPVSAPKFLAEVPEDEFDSIALNANYFA